MEASAAGGLDLSSASATTMLPNGDWAGDSGVVGFQHVYALDDPVDFRFPVYGFQNAAGRQRRDGIVGFT